VFRRADGVSVMYAHVQDVQVRPNDVVVAGQPVARVGNNGYAWFPHTHVGAWKGDRPLQVRFDLRAMAALRRSE
jgi:murein DD-endopeptidase MepM/ murein hydrolase activator NlpD